jgi:hypothetical protein
MAKQIKDRCVVYPFYHVARPNHLISMGSTSAASGTGKSTTVTPGQSVQQQQTGGCC